MRSLGDDPLGLNALGGIYDKRIALSLSNVPEVSLVLLREAKVALDSDKRPEALKLIEHATLISPDMLEPHLLMIKLHLTGRLFGAKAPGLLAELSTVASLTRNDPLKLLRLCYNGAIFLFAAMCLLTALVVGMLLIKSARRALHQTLHIFPKRTPFYFAAALLLTAFVCLYITLGWPACVLLALTLCWRYADNFEKIAVGVLALLLLAVPTLYSRFANNLEAASGAYFAILQIHSGFDLDDKATRIKEHLAANPDDTLAQYALAVAEKAAGRTDVAKQMLEQINAKGFYDKASITLANLLYRTDNTSAAIDLYKRIVTKTPMSALPFYNLGKIYYNEAQLEEGNKTLRRAKQLDPIAYDRWERDFQRDTVSGIHLFEPLITWNDLHKQLGAIQPQQMPRAYIFHTWLAFGVVLLLSLTSVFFPNWERNRAISCDRCGAVNCPKCDLAASGSHLCPQCYNIYFKKATLDPDLKVKKERQIRGYQTRQSIYKIVATLACPGLGHHYAGTYVASLPLLILSALLFTLLLPLPTAPAPYYFPVFAGLFHFMLGCAAVALYALGLFTVVRR